MTVVPTASTAPDWLRCARSWTIADARHGNPFPSPRTRCPGAPHRSRCPLNYTLRNEAAADIAAIHALTAAAFATAEHSSHTADFIVDALRARGELAVSLVAEVDGERVGHVAISPVAVSDGSSGWFGLGPISVLPGWQGQGIGAALMHAALEALRQQGARGCVLLGEPGYYGRFGFRAEPGLILPGVPAEYFQALCLRPPMAQGEVQYSPAFEATS
ncbi:hypothetical protein G6F65_011471 [Rhizopus arrhizus]|nr:hypothetical protein G6F65_011471 [Rhizopus arrhizus]